VTKGRLGGITASAAARDTVQQPIIGGFLFALSMYYSCVLKHHFFLFRTP